MEVALEKIEGKVSLVIIADIDHIAAIPVMNVNTEEISVVAPPSFQVASSLF